MPIPAATGAAGATGADRVTDFVTWQPPCVMVNEYVPAGMPDIPDVMSPEGDHAYDQGALPPVTTVVMLPLDVLVQTGVTVVKATCNESVAKVKYSLLFSITSAYSFPLAFISG